MHAAFVQQSKCNNKASRHVQTHNSSHQRTKSYHVVSVSETGSHDGSIANRPGRPDWALSVTTLSAGRLMNAGKD